MSERLTKDDNLRGVKKAEFVGKLTNHFGDWNALHPFREGNGRATSEFFGQIARGAGFFLRSNEDRQRAGSMEYCRTAQHVRRSTIVRGNLRQRYSIFARRCI